MSGKQLVVLCTVPDTDIGGSIATTLVSEKLAACVNILPGAHSIYEWQGKLEKEPEFVLLIKSREDRLEVLKERLLAQHPYELPELIAVLIEKGSATYLSWIDTQLDK